MRTTKMIDWKCAGCGILVPDLIKVCDCATGCAYRRMPGSKMESALFFANKNHAEWPHLTPREANLAAALKLARCICADAFKDTLMEWDTDSMAIIDAAISEAEWRRP